MPQKIYVKKVTAADGNMEIALGKYDRVVEWKHVLASDTPAVDVPAYNTAAGVEVAAVHQPAVHHDAELHAVVITDEPADL